MRRPVPAYVQQNLGVPVSHRWDATTLGAIPIYQGALGLDVTGNPDPPTLASLDYYDPLLELQPKWRDHLLDGKKKPSSLGRDLATAANQIPWWAWLGTGLILAGAGYYSWRKQR